MAQIVIDGVLFSPVLAHSLEPGDLIATGTVQPMARVAAVTRVLPQRPDEIHAVRVDWPLWGSTFFGLNDSVLRAVGARAGRGGAR